MRGIKVQVIFYYLTGIEGHRIANLAKQTAYRPAGQDGDEEDEKEKNAQLDNYVLHKLFKKSGMSLCKG